MRRDRPVTVRDVGSTRPPSSRKHQTSTASLHCTYTGGPADHRTRSRRGARPNRIDNDDAAAAVATWRMFASGRRSTRGTRPASDETRRAVSVCPWAGRRPGRALCMRTMHGLADRHFAASSRPDAPPQTARGYFDNETSGRSRDGHRPDGRRRPTAGGRP